MANTLTRMERDGLVERRPHPSDKRAQLLFLTERAKGLQEAAEAAARAAKTPCLQAFGASSASSCSSICAGSSRTPASLKKTLTCLPDHFRKKTDSGLSHFRLWSRPTYL